MAQQLNCKNSGVEICFKTLLDVGTVKPPLLVGGHLDKNVAPLVRCQRAFLGLCICLVGPTLWLATNAKEFREGVFTCGGNRLRGFTGTPLGIHRLELK